MMRSNGRSSRQVRRSACTKRTRSRAFGSSSARFRSASASMGSAISTPTISKPASPAILASGVVTRPLPDASSSTRRGFSLPDEPLVELDVLVVAFVFEVVVQWTFVDRFHVRIPCHLRAMASDVKEGSWRHDRRYERKERTGRVLRPHQRHRDRDDDDPAGGWPPGVACDGDPETGVGRRPVVRDARRHRQAARHRARSPHQPGVLQGPDARVDLGVGYRDAHAGSREDPRALRAGLGRLVSQGGRPAARHHG